MTEISSRQSLLLDVDTGVDDALALALALSDPRSELVSVSTLAGNVNVTNTTANTLAVLDWLGATAVPVHRGASLPLIGPVAIAADVHGDDGLGGAPLPPSRRSVAASYGPASLIQRAKERHGELTLVCVGPLTNLAIALNVEPNLGKLLQKIVIMGGAFDVPGNVTPFAEFNIFCDPEAAARVFQASLPDVTVVGLDVTHQAFISRTIWEQIRRLTSPTSMLVNEVCRATFTTRKSDRFYLHDPLAVGVALDSSLVECEIGRVDIGLQGDDRGRTRLSNGGSVKIAKHVNADLFWQQFSDTLGLRNR